MNEALFASAIEASGMILAAIITFAGMFIASKRLTSRAKLKNDLKLAYEDLMVLYAIEEAHIQQCREVSGTSNKVKIRRLVEAEKGFSLSSYNVPSKLKRKLTYLDGLLD